MENTKSTLSGDIIVTGDVYLLDSDANPHPPTLPSEPMDVEDLMNNESIDLLDEVDVIVEEIIEDVSPF